MARINVYLPDDLAASAKQADLPLSQILREAVLAHLGQLGHSLTDAGPALRESALRLMATAGEGKISQTASGLEAGERWASDFASLDELAELPTIADAIVTFSGNHSAARFLLRAFPQLPPMHRDEWLRADQQRDGVRFKATPFMSGFLDGARMHFAKVAPVIESLREAGGPTGRGDGGAERRTSTKRASTRGRRGRSSGTRRSTAP